MIVRFLRWIFRFYWSSSVVGVTHLGILALIYFGILRTEGLRTMSFATEKNFWSTDFIVILILIFLHAIGLGLLWRRIVRKIAPLLQAVLTLSLAGICIAVVFLTIESDPADMGLAGAQIIEGAILTVAFSTAFLIHVAGYLFSKNPEPLLPGKRQVRMAPRKLTSFLQSRTVISITLLILIIVNSVGLFLVWERTNRIERYLGGKRALSCDERKTLEDVKPSVVRIISGLGEGTGMIVRDDGVVLTNAHVVEGEPAPKVILPDYSFRTASIVMLDTDADIALLKIEGSYRPLELAYPDKLNKFDPLLVLGYPMGTALKGDVTVTRGVFVSTRSTKQLPVSHIQFDGTVNPGNSGGPLMTLCGSVVGMTTYGGPGIGLAISSDDILSSIGFLSDRNKELPTVAPVALNPEKGPLEAVQAFYAYIKMRNFQKAYELVSPSRLENQSLEEWQRGYEKTIDVTLFLSRPTEEKPDKIFVKLIALDLVDEEVEETYYEGEWLVLSEDGVWRLGPSDIRKVDDPPFFWFWDEAGQE